MAVSLSIFTTSAFPSMMSHGEGHSHYSSTVRLFSKKISSPATKSDLALSMVARCFLGLSWPEAEPEDWPEAEPDALREGSPETEPEDWPEAEPED